MPETVAPLLRRAPGFLLLLAGCWTSAQHGEQIDNRLKALEADDRDQQAAILAQRQQLADQIPRIDAKLKEINETLDRVNQAMHRTGADVGVRLDELEGKLQSLRGTLEETQHRLDQMSASEDARFAAILGPQAVAELSAKQKATSLAPADRGALFATANKQLETGDAAVARELFAEYLRRYPKDAQAGDAQYGIAESFYRESKYKEAALGYQKVTDQYPSASLVCDARLKLGMALVGLKLRDDARVAFEEAVRRCAAKPAVVSEAKAQLADLKRGAPKSKKTAP
jgi:TolA-binding protein